MRVLVICTRMVCPRIAAISPATDDADVAAADGVELERGDGPAHVDLPRHDLRDGGGRVAGADRLGLEPIFVDEFQHRNVGGGSGRRVGDGGIMRVADVL